MIRVGIIGPDGQIVSPQQLATASELQQVVEQARRLISECERLATTMSTKDRPAQTKKVPYG
jgi:hypothetical protein